MPTQRIFDAQTGLNNMNKSLILAALLAGVAAPAFAQDVNSNSNSGAAANSGSVSGAESNGNQQSQANIGGNNAGIGSSTSESNSGAVSGSNSASHSGSYSDQGQSQGQSANNSQGQSQGQNANLTAGQTASNTQGVSVTNQFNSTNHKRSYVGTNAAVPLAASSSFSSDYCGGTVSGGASAAPIGISIGGAAPTFDDSCRYLRVAEKAGMLGANYHNAGYPELAGRAFTLEAFATCMAGPQADKRRKGNSENVIMQACIKLGLLGSDNVAAEVPVMPMAAPPQSPEVTPLETQKPNGVNPDDYTTLPPKTPRGDAGTPSPLAVAH